jgi:hypothetical protein
MPRPSNRRARRARGSNAPTDPQIRVAQRCSSAASGGW